MTRSSASKVSIEPKAIHSEADAKSAIAKFRKAIRYHDQKYYSENAPVISDAKLLEQKGAAKAQCWPSLTLLCRKQAWITEWRLE